MNLDDKVALLRKLPYQMKSTDELASLSRDFPTTFTTCGTILDTFAIVTYGEWGGKKQRLGVMAQSTFLVIDSGSCLRRDLPRLPLREPQFRGRKPRKPAGHVH